jgi:predicted naringenin-chalcone synthase
LRCRRVLPFALSDVAGPAGLMIGLGPGVGAELALLRW